MLAQHKGFTLNMLGKLTSMQERLLPDLMGGFIEQTELEMAKTYQQFLVTKPIGTGFVMGLSDFACLGWSFYDLAGYPYDDEQAALFSDWVRLGTDVKTAIEKLEEAKAE